MIGGRGREAHSRSAGEMDERNVRRRCFCCCWSLPSSSSSSWPSASAEAHARGGGADGEPGSSVAEAMFRGAAAPRHLIVEGALRPCRTPIQRMITTATILTQGVSLSERRGRRKAACGFEAVVFQQR